jgi:hypothetical protein
VEKYAWIEDHQASQPYLLSNKSTPNEFILTLTSDLIDRHDDLTFRTTLDGPALLRLAGLDESEFDASINVAKEVCETWVVHGYNTASGTRRSPDLAIKRGSAFLVQCKNTEPLQKLFRALVDRGTRGQGLGERQEEGFGRFVLDHPCHQGPRNDTAKPDGENMSVKRENNSVMADANDTRNAHAKHRAEREQAIETVLLSVKQMGLAQLCVDKTFPARSQWQWLRHRLEVLRKAQDLKALINDIRTQSTKLSGKMWTCTTKDHDKQLIDALDSWRKQLSTFEQQRTFLIYLARWVVVQQHRHRRERGRGERNA